MREKREGRARREGGTTAFILFILFLIAPSLQISCFGKTKENQYAKYDLNIKRIAARLI